MGYTFATIHIPVELTANINRYVCVFAGPGLSFNMKMQKKEWSGFRTDSEYYALSNAMADIFKLTYFNINYGASINWKNFLLTARHQKSLSSLTKGFSYKSNNFYMPINASGLFVKLGYSINLNPKSK